MHLQLYLKKACIISTRPALLALARIRSAFDLDTFTVPRTGFSFFVRGTHRAMTVFAGVAGVADAGATAVLREHRLASLASSAELLAALSSAKREDALTEVDLEVLVRRPGRAVPADGERED